MDTIYLFPVNNKNDLFIIFFDAIPALLLITGKVLPAGAHQVNRI
jgi:hypothetical protein